MGLVATASASAGGISRRCRPPDRGCLGAAVVVGAAVVAVVVASAGPAELDGPELSPLSSELEAPELSSP